MNSEVTLTEVEDAAVETSRPGRFSIYAELTKARLTMLVLLTTLAGFLLGIQQNFNFLLLINTLLGTALLAASASALNQWMERKWDSLMKRTNQRPLPAKHIRPIEALSFGIITAFSGTAYLFYMVNSIAAIVALSCLLTYLLIYTPLKRFTSLNTLIGAIPGALPPVIGWTAARGTWDTGAWILFGVLFFWQMPHFLSIAWLYREDYKQAGFRMLSNDDTSGKVTSRHAMVYCIALLFVSLLPMFTGMSGTIYLIGAFIFGLAFLSYCLRFMIQRTEPRAKALFLASVLYLPCLLALMILNQV
ncbi:MAG: heme o synthase [Verrucomicrobiota bacterium]